MDSSAGGHVRHGVKGGGLKRSKSAHVSLGRSGSAMDLDEPSGEEAPPRSAGNYRGSRNKSPAENTIEEEEEEEEEAEPMDSCECFTLLKDLFAFR